MCKIRGRRTRSLGLALRHVDSDTDRPGEGEYRDEDVDRDDHHPTPCSRVIVDDVPRIEPADQKHDAAEPKSTVNSTISTAPFVGKEKSRNGYAEDDNRRDARGEKGSF